MQGQGVGVMGMDSVTLTLLAHMPRGVWGDSLLGELPFQTGLRGTVLLGTALALSLSAVASAMGTRSRDSPLRVQCCLTGEWESVEGNAVLEPMLLSSRSAV